MSPAAALPDVIRHIERVPADIVAQAARFPSSILADVAGRRGALHGRIAPLSPSMRFAGPALTVEVRPGDNLMIHAAMAIAQNRMVHAGPNSHAGGAQAGCTSCP